MLKLQHEKNIELKPYTSQKKGLNTMQDKDDDESK